MGVGAPHADFACGVFLCAQGPAVILVARESQQPLLGHAFSRAVSDEHGKRLQSLRRVPRTPDLRVGSFQEPAVSVRASLPLFLVRENLGARDYVATPAP
jgi:hypothetical protein